jgi:hypothetical protein
MKCDHMGRGLPIIGYDTSSSAHDLSVICEACSDEHGDGGGSPIYDGDEWGGPIPACSHCGEALSGLVQS